MKKIGIAEFKAHLSAYLQRVRRGESLTLFDRDSPLARVVPYSGDKPQLVVRRGTGSLHDVKLPPPLKLPIDVVELLLEERSDR